MSFESLNLNAKLLNNIAAAGYTKPTPIQAATIPLTLTQCDLIATAQTGTGKTAAYVLPTLQRLMDNKPGKGRGPRVLILAPTRELAIQVKDSVEKYAKGLQHFNIATVLGGMPYHLQNRQLSRSVDVLVATPGRLIDHMEQGNVDFSRLEMLILDEADRMLDMGFFEDVEHIVASTPAERQTLMFSATFDKQVARLAQKLLKNPERIDIASQKAQHNQIEQQLHYVNAAAHKKSLLLELMNNAKVDQAIVFTATKRGADELAEEMEEQGYSVASLHGDMRQRVRNRTLELLRRGRIQYLVATDVAARGIDVSSISHVFNFDLPRIAEDYVHRIGRTGRAGAFGTAISIATMKEKQTVKRIEQYIGHRIMVQGGNPERGARASSKNPRMMQKERDFATPRGEREASRGQERAYDRKRKERDFATPRSEREPFKTQEFAHDRKRKERDFAKPRGEWEPSKDQERFHERKRSARPSTKYFDAKSRPSSHQYAKKKPLSSRKRASNSQG